MLRIGDFSKLSRVSIKMLRHYDDIDLLKPAKTDEFTGCRYYREEQLFIMRRITALKDMGFALADIVRILEIYEDKEKLDSFLRAKQQELSDLSKQTEYKMMLLDTARKRLREEQNMSFDVAVKAIPERYAATVHMIIPHYEDEGMTWHMLEACKEPLTPADPCLAATEYLDEEYKAENVEIVVWMTVKGKYEDTEHVKFKTLPAVKVASCIMKGNYDQMSDVTATVISWVNANGYKACAPKFNIHLGLHQTQNPDDYVTEVCFPIE